MSSSNLAHTSASSLLCGATFSSKLAHCLIAGREKSCSGASLHLIHSFSLNRPSNFSPAFCVKIAESKLELDKTAGGEILLTHSCLVKKTDIFDLCRQASITGWKMFCFPRLTWKPVRIHCPMGHISDFSSVKENSTGDPHCVSPKRKFWTEKLFLLPLAEYKNLQKRIVQNELLVSQHRHKWQRMNSLEVRHLAWKSLFWRFQDKRPKFVCFSSLSNGIYYPEFHLEVSPTTGRSPV